MERLGERFVADAETLSAALSLPSSKGRAELRRLVRSMRSIARELSWVATGKLDAPRRERLDLVALIRDAATRWKVALERRGARLDIHAAPKKVVGRWDRLQIETTLGELLSNACKHGDGRSVVVNVTTTRGRVHVTVEDVGTGPLPKRPFQRFVRGPTSKGVGVGVGLWLVSAIAKQNGGGLRFRRSPSKGTQAIVSLRR
jgi:two-component system, sensor histidine kinase and response regulator